METKTIFEQVAEKNGIKPKKKPPEKKNNYLKTICWKCKNDNCQWISKLKPIPGWVAEKTTVASSRLIDGKIEQIRVPSFRVDKCPKFK